MYSDVYIYYTICDKNKKTHKKHVKNFFKIKNCVYWGNI